MHRRGGRDSGGCQIGIAAKHLHKGQGNMPDGGKGWHHAFQTGREERLEREKGGGWGVQSIVHPLFRKRRSLTVGRRAG